MSTQGIEYRKVRKKLKAQLKKCRDRDIRFKAELVLYVLREKELRGRTVEISCGVYGKSKGFYYKWLGRLRKGQWKLKALVEKSRRPKRSPRKIDGYTEKRIAHYRKSGYGALMIKGFMQREGRTVSESTIGHVLRQRVKKPQPRQAKLKKHTRRYELAVPGERLQMDVKYVPYLVGGERAFTYVIVDECTRWRFSYAYKAINGVTTVDFLEKLKQVCPFPINCIQTDNGQEFTWRLLPFVGSKVHPMDAWCEMQGIRHRHILPGVKEHNGKVERLHRIDEEYFYHRAPRENLDVFNRSLLAWNRFYNRKRPHYSLGYLTPIEKLHERQENLKKEKLDIVREPMKQKFLMKAPIMMTKEERQLLELQRVLSFYNFKYAS